MTLRESFAIIKNSIPETADDTLREAVATLDNYFSYSSELEYFKAQNEKIQEVFRKAMEDHI
jgi:hypothetical protein